MVLVNYRSVCGHVFYITLLTSSLKHKIIPEVVVMLFYITCCERVVGDCKGFFLGNCKLTSTVDLSGQEGQ